MLNLVSKDFIMQKKSFFSAILYCFTLNLFFSNVPLMIFIFLPPLIACIYIDTACSNEYKYGTDILFNSLPTQRREIVISKYISSFIVLILAVAITLIFTWLFRLSNISEIFKLYRIINIRNQSNSPGYISGIISCIESTALLISVYLPVYFKSGYAKSKNTSLFIVLIVFLAAISLIKNADRSFLYHVFNNIKSMPIWITTSISILIMILVLGESVILSVRYYNNKDL